MLLDKIKLLKDSWNFPIGLSNFGGDKYSKRFLN